MKRPEFRPFAREDFPDAPWIEKLIRPLNTVLGAVVAGLGNGITLGENLNAEIRTLDVTTRDEWVPLTLENSWVAASDLAVVPAYHRDPAGNVHFRGEVSGGAFSTTLRIGQVAAGYRPMTLKSQIVESHNAGGSHFPAYIEITPAGDIFPHSGTTATDLALNGLSYHAHGPTLPNPAFPVRFTTKVKGKVVGVLVLRCVELDGRNEIPSLDALSVGWSQDGQTVLLNGVAGLAEGRTYRLTVAVIGG